MTPQLMQAIKLLQMSNLELSAYVENELEKNPFLERQSEGESQDRDPGEDRPDHPVSDGVEPAAASESDLSGTDMTPVAAAPQDLDAPAETVYSEDGPGDSPAPPEPPAYRLEGTSNGSGSGGAGEDYNLEAFVSAEETLPDHLEKQLNLAFDEGIERQIGRVLIDAVDEGGYLRTSVEEVAERLSADPLLVGSVLETVQSFEPSGIGARDLQECLALQLKELDRFDPAMEALVANLELLARRDFQKLKSLCGVDDDDLREMFAEIQALNPKPGSIFGGEPGQIVVPDVLVTADPSGGWRVELNPDTVPAVLVARSYYAIVSKSAKDAGEKAYLSESIQTANWLVKSLDQRARTIVKVAKEIVKQQDAFFAYGITHLRPLNLKTVADAIEMHESTVSRVTSGKYMATPRGNFELKYFFTAAISATGGGEAHSAESVRFQIREMIDAESPAAVLSDDTIVRHLQDAGIDIARRTVAKYREAMRIPSSVQRRREKKALAGL